MYPAKKEKSLFPKTQKNDSDSAIRNIINKEGFVIWRLDHILSGRDGASKLARGAILAAHSLHEPRPISNQPVAWRVPRRVRR